MKSLLLCDDCRYESVADLSRKYAMGMEVQSFHAPEVYDDPSALIDGHLTALEGIGLRALHGPFADLNPGSPDPMLREVAAKRIHMGYETASRLGVQHLVYHLGYVPRTGAVSPWVERCVAFWRDFLAAHEGDIAIHIENLLEVEPIMLSDVIAGIDSKRVDVCLDIGHAHANSSTDLFTWIITLGSDIGYVHMHDNHGQYDEHLGLGRGTTPMVDACKALNEYAPQAVWAIEVAEEDLDDSLEWLAVNGFL